MTNIASEEEPGFEADVDELPEDDLASPDALEDEPLPEDDAPALDEAQGPMTRTRSLLT